MVLQLRRYHLRILSHAFVEIYFPQGFIFTKSVFLKSLLRLFRNGEIDVRFLKSFFRCPPTSWLHASSPSTASIVSCAAFAVSQSMPSCSPDVSLRHTSTIPRVSTVHTLPWPNQPLCTRLLFVDCRPLHITQRYKSQGFVTSSRDATLPTRAITVSFLWMQCTIASSTPTVHSLRPVAHVRVGLFICLLFVVYLLNIFNFHWSFNLSFFLSLLTLIYSGARGGKRIQRSLSLVSMLFQLTPTIYDHTSQFLLLNTFLSIAYFSGGGVIYPVLCRD